MATKKMKKNPAAIAARVEGRKKFVGEARKKGVDARTARKRYYVQTRSAELTAAGKKVDKAALRKKFESGGVTREGFYNEQDMKRNKKSKTSTPRPQSGAAYMRAGRPKGVDGGAIRAQSRKAMRGK